MSEYLVVIEHEGESWGAYCPDLPGVGVVGESQGEVEQLIREAIGFHLDSLRQAGEPILQPTAVGRRSPRCLTDRGRFAQCTVRLLCAKLLHGGN